MSLTVTILEPSDYTTETDYTDFLRPWKGFEMGGRAFDGEADGDGSMYFDDEESVLSPLNDVAKGKRVFIEEDASGAAKALFVGRIWDRDWERPGVKADRARSMVVNVVDANMDLSGIIVDGWSRPAEEPYVRVLALLAAYLNGSSSTATNADDADFGIWGRYSTVIGDAYVNTGGVGATMPATTYTETEPRTILRECCEWAGYDAFVIANDDRTLDLFFDEPTSTAYTSTLSISDDPDDVGTANVYQPWWNAGPAMHQSGEQQGSGVLLVGANEDRVYHQLGTSVTDTNDKWEFLERTDATAQADLNTLASRLAHFREQESRTISCSILVPADKVHLIKPGMRVQVKRAYAATVGLPNYFRAFQVRYIWHTAEFYLVALNLGFPVKLVRRRGGLHGPTDGTEGACTRLYFSTNAGAVAPATSASWDDDDTGGSVHTLKTTADGTYGSATSTTTSIGGAAGGRDVAMWRGVYGPISAELAAGISAGGGTVRGQLRARARFGIGISEASQDMISQMNVRVTQGASTTIRGTALNLHAASSTAGASIWPAQATKVNRSFPPNGQTRTLSAVANTAAGDYLVIEVGKRDFTTVTGGGSIALASDAASDLPEDELETGALNSWIDICTPSSAGDTPGSVVNPGEESNGTDYNCYARCDHTHAHGFLADDDVHMHDADQIAGLTEPDLSGLQTTTLGGQEGFLDHGNTGTTETLDLADANVHKVTLDNNCTFTFTGATSGVECRLRVIMQQDASGSRAPTWPASVIWPGDTEPTWSTAADAVDVIEFITVDGGVTWYGDAGGGSGSVTLSDDTPLVESGSGSAGASTEASRSDHVHPAATSTPPQILLASDHGTPFTFDDILQESDGSDFLWASE